MLGKTVCCVKQSGGRCRKLFSKGKKGGGGVGMLVCTRGWRMGELIFHVHRSAIAFLFNPLGRKWERFASVLYYFIVAMHFPFFPLRCQVLRILHSNAASTGPMLTVKTFSYKPQWYQMGLTHV